MKIYVKMFARLSFPCFNLPMTSDKKPQIVARVRPFIHTKIKASASRNRRTLVAEVESIIEEHFAAKKEAKA